LSQISFTEAVMRYCNTQPYNKSTHLDRRALLIIAISLALGLGVAQVPQILEHLPELFRNIFSSGVATGGIAALILNIVLPETKK
jgi:xanthine permease XanP